MRDLLEKTGEERQALRRQYCIKSTLRVVVSGSALDSPPKCQSVSHQARK